VILLAAVLALVAGAGGYALAYRRAARDGRQIAALLLGLREGDFTLRARRARGAMGGAYAAVNALADQLRGDRQAGIESDALLGKLLGAVNLAIIICGPHGTITSGNEAAAALLGVPDADRLIGLAPAALGIGDWLNASGPTRFEAPLPGGTGPWEVRRVRFRRGGRAHDLLLASDVSLVLRAEERRVWRGLIRVLSHETGNSLGPIQATAQALAATLERAEIGELRAGLALIERRARSLAGFIRRYAELARLPPPAPEPVELTHLLRRVAALETSLPVALSLGAPVEITLDPTQIEQALINLLRNAADAARETGGGVSLTLVAAPAAVEIAIEDDGPGLPRTENLFVPGFTTKPGGSGIGLVLAREIIEAHGGRLHLANRTGAPGAVARISLPMPPAGEG
jgi:nitrogen fixation/metabolism regulation signal transduction histidine kinase